MTAQYLITFLFLFNNQTILNIFSLTVSLEGWNTDLCLLLHIVHSTLLPVILHTWSMGLWWGVWVVVGWSWLVVVDIGFG